MHFVREKELCAFLRSTETATGVTPLATCCSDQSPSPRTSLHTIRGAGPELLGLDSVADGICSRASQGSGPCAGVRVFCLNRARIRVISKRKLLFADGCERTPSELESHPWWHFGGEVK